MQSELITSVLLSLYMHEDGGDRWSVKTCVRIACLVDVCNSEYVMVHTNSRFCSNLNGFHRC